MKIRTWINNRTDVRTKRLTVRVEHRLSLEETATALVRELLDISDDPYEWPESLSQDRIGQMVRQAYAYYGANAVWAWSDDYSTEEAKSLRDEARNLILSACPEFAAERSSR